MLSYTVMRATRLTHHVPRKVVMPFTVARVVSTFLFTDNDPQTQYLSQDVCSANITRLFPSICTNKFRKILRPTWD
jgi:hypothetical protein